MSRGSLLDSIAAPVVVGDPQGRVVYVNPGFVECFLGDGRKVTGVPFADLFAGEAREAVLQAVADVCEQGRTIHFRMCEDGRGYRASASPIEAEDEGAVGVVMVFNDEPIAAQRILTVYRRMYEPLEEARGCLDELIDQMGGHGDEHHRDAAKRALAALDVTKKWGDVLHSLLSDECGETLDPFRVCHTVVGRLAADFDLAGVELDVAVPALAPAAEGDARHLETILARLLRDRLAQAQRDEAIGLVARVPEGGAPQALISVVDRPERLARYGPKPDFGRDAIVSLAGYEHTCLTSAMGRVTTISIALANARS